MTRVSNCAALLTLMMAASLSADEWEWSLGVNWRSFRDVRLKEFAFNNGNCVDGNVEQMGGGLWRYTVRSPVNQVSGSALNEVTYRTVSFSGDSDNSDHGKGVAFGGSRVLGRAETVTVRLDLSLSTARADSGHGSAATQEYETWSIGADSWSAGPVPDPDKPSLVSANHTRIVSSETANSVSVVRHDLNACMYAVGAGLSLSCRVSGVDVVVGAGPGLSVIDYDFRRVARCAWIDGSTFYSEETGTDATKVRAGGYASIGICFPAMGPVAIGISGRYDYIPDELNTDIAEIDLSGFTAQLAVTWRF